MLRRIAGSLLIMCLTLQMGCSKWVTLAPENKTLKARDLVRITLSDYTVIQGEVVTVDEQGLTLKMLYIKGPEAGYRFSRYMWRDIVKLEKRRR